MFHTYRKNFYLIGFISTFVTIGFVINSLWIPPSILGLFINLLLVIPLLFYYYIFQHTGISLKRILTFPNRRRDVLSPLFLCGIFFLFLVGFYYFIKDKLSIGELYLFITKQNSPPSIEYFVFYGIFFVLLIPFLYQVFYQGFIFLNISTKGKVLEGYLCTALLFTLSQSISLIHTKKPIYFGAVFLFFFLFSLLSSYLNRKVSTIYPGLFLHIVLNISITTMCFLSIY